MSEPRNRHPVVDGPTPAHDLAWAASDTAAPPSPSDPLTDRLQALREVLLARERHSAAQLQAVLASHRASARNLLHFLALRSVDLRGLQAQLSALGLSSLGRAEPRVLASLERVQTVVACLQGERTGRRRAVEVVDRVVGQAVDEAVDEAADAACEQALEANTLALLGPQTPGRPTRIMVTLPAQAATDADLVRALVAAGMEVARINCAHDDAKVWRAMARQVRRAARAAGREVRILMDLAGPKIRTGALAPEPAVLKLRPQRDALGRVAQGARLGLRSADSEVPVPGADVHVGVLDAWLARLEPGMVLEFDDARGKRRRLRVRAVGPWGALAEGMHTAYLTPQTLLMRAGSGRQARRATPLYGIAARPGELHLARGTVLWLVREGLGGMAPAAACAPAETGEETPIGWPRIACTLPQVLDQVRVGERVWFDDGRIGGVIRAVGAQAVAVEITQAREGGETLRADKGINLPDSRLDLPALTEKDVLDLRAVAALADLVALSFVHEARDVQHLCEHLRRLGREDMGLVLKIETRRGFENLPALMLEAMRWPHAGLMIARGDLAVECGYERMAEVQEEILWAAEAAHMPVIWATQVLETLARTGVPSRAEVSDAALGARAECVMLNKGPFVVDAVRTLDGILRRMHGLQYKKRPLLRALRAWGGALPDAAPEAAAPEPAPPAKGAARKRAAVRTT